MWVESSPSPSGLIPGMPLPIAPMPLAELRHCSSLRELNLEGNKLTTPVLDLRHLAQLQSLQVCVCRGGWHVLGWGGRRVCA